MSGERWSAEQAEFWRGVGGARWLAFHESTDALLAPITARLFEAAAPRAGETALDIGCGTGASTRLLADAVAPDGAVTGIDISARLLDVARRRVPHASFIEADAATHRFDTGFDLAISRFGVMFFGDPEAGFANLRAALAPAGRLVFACWRTLAENPWARLPLEAALRHVPAPPRPAPGEPGPFSLGDASRLHATLAAAGFGQVSLAPFDTELDLARGEGLEQAVNAATAIGPAAAALRDRPEAEIEAARDAIRAMLARHASGTTVRLHAAIWIADARL